MYIICFNHVPLPLPSLPLAHIPLNSLPTGILSGSARASQSDHSPPLQLTPWPRPLLPYSVLGLSSGLSSSLWTNWYNVQWTPFDFCQHLPIFQSLSSCAFHFNCELLTGCYLDMQLRFQSKFNCVFHICVEDIFKYKNTWNKSSF